MTWFSSWFGGSSNATAMQLEEHEERLVYDPAQKRYVPESQVGAPPAAVASATSCPPQMTYSPPVPSCAQPAVNTSARRPRYVDPFTDQVHQTTAPVVDIGVAAQPVA